MKGKWCEPLVSVVVPEVKKVVRISRPQVRGKSGSLKAAVGTAGISCQRETVSGVFSSDRAKAA